MAVRAVGSMLITVQNRKELWFVPAPSNSLPVEPLFLHTFEFNTTFVVEWEPERFLLGVADVYDTCEAKLYEIGLGGWSPGLPISPRLVLEFPEPWAGLNGACFIAPNVLLAAGVAGLIWRVDLGDASRASARIWLQHDSNRHEGRGADSSGWARVSTIDQNLALQRDALAEAGCEKMFHRATVGCGCRPAPTPPRSRRGPRHRRDQWTFPLAEKSPVGHARSRYPLDMIV